MLSIHQPSYWPWLGLLYKIANTNNYVFLEDVAASKTGYQYRNIFYCTGEPKFLSLPVDYHLGVKLNELNFKNRLYIDDHLNKLKNYYLKAKYFDEGFHLAKTVLESDFDRPIDLLFKTLSVMLDVFNIKTSIYRSSQLEYSGQKEDLVLDICVKMKAEIYVAGMGGLNYMGNLKKFEDKGINVMFYKFNGFEYYQGSGYPFLSGLASLDIIMFNGIEKSRKLFWENYSKNQILKKSEII